MYKSEGTETSYGFIPHLKRADLDLPVVLRTIAGRVAVIGRRNLPAPLFDNGRLVFALPGGGKLKSNISDFNLKFDALCGALTN